MSEHVEDKTQERSDIIFGLENLTVVVADLEGRIAV